MQTHIFEPELLSKFIICLSLVLITIIHTKLYTTSMKATVECGIPATHLTKTISFIYNFYILRILCCILCRGSNP